MTSKKLTTSIPDKYHKYVKNKKLRFSELLIRSIENEMAHDPDAIQKEIQEIETKKEELLSRLKETKRKDVDKKDRIKSMHEGLMPSG